MTRAGLIPEYESSSTVAPLHRLAEIEKDAAETAARKSRASVLFEITGGVFTVLALLLASVSGFGSLGALVGQRTAAVIAILSAAASAVSAFLQTKVGSRGRARGAEAWRRYADDVNDEVVRLVSLTPVAASTFRVEATGALRRMRSREPSRISEFEQREDVSSVRDRTGEAHPVEGERSMHPGNSGVGTDDASLPLAVGDRIRAGEVLPVGHSIVSSNGRFALTYQSDGNLVLYGPTGATWDSHTTNRGVGLTTLQEDGNLVVYAPRGTPVWDSGTAGNRDSQMIVQDDGNLVIYRSDQSPAWASNTT